MKALILVIFLLCFAGCSTFGRNSLFHSETSPPITHTVKFRGETLAIISRWYTGSAANWTKIARANSLTDPKSIQLGRIVIIPRSLVKKTTPMPNSFVMQNTDSQLDANEWPGNVGTDATQDNLDPITEPCRVP